MTLPLGHLLVMFQPDASEAEGGEHSLELNGLLHTQTAEPRCGFGPNRSRMPG